MLVMLLNLLIAIISSEFEQVMSEIVITKYKFRCDMNYEASMFKETIKKIFGQNIK